MTAPTSITVFGIAPGGIGPGTGVGVGVGVGVGIGVGFATGRKGLGPVGEYRSQAEVIVSSPTHSANRSSPEHIWPHSARRLDPRWRNGRNMKALLLRVLGKLWEFHGFANGQS